MILNEYYVLYNGVKIPKIGFGTWQIPNGPEAYNSTLMALKNGYRHIDTAAVYGNEVSVGKAIKDSNIKRSDIFVTSKLRASHKGYQIALDDFQDTLDRLGLDYLDLYLIHAPWPWEDRNHCVYAEGNIQSWKAMEKLYKEGKIRSIGVSNFLPSDLQPILDNCEIVPMVNQISYHIGLDQKETEVFCKNKNILIEAYSPFATGRIFKVEKVTSMAEKYKVTPAQLCIGWCLQHGTLPLPKSTHEERIINNATIDFTISEEDMLTLDLIRTPWTR